MGFHLSADQSGAVAPEIQQRSQDQPTPEASGLHTTKGETATRVNRRHVRIYCTILREADCIPSN